MNRRSKTPPKILLSAAKHIRRGRVSHQQDTAGKGGQVQEGPGNQSGPSLWKAGRSTTTPSCGPAARII